MQKKLGEIAKIIQGEIVGDKDVVITGICGIKEAQKGDITFVANSKYFSHTEKTQASAIIAPRGMSIAGKTCVRVDNPSLAFANLMSLFLEDQPRPVIGIHKTAVIGKDVVLGKDVCIGPYVVIEEKAKIGDKTILGSGCFVGQDTTIGSDCQIYPNVTIRERIKLGERVIVHSGAVIGSDGFGFVSVDGTHRKIPQLGNVIIEDDVEIGANVTIDRARFGKTFIGSGTKTDNLVHIAHNVSIGKNCLVIAQVGISGTVTVEDNVILAGQAGVAGHLRIGKGSVVTAQAGVTKSFPANSILFGMPARTMAQAKRVHASLQRLPEYIKAINELKARVEDLESQLKKKTHGKTKNN